MIHFLLQSDSGSGFGEFIGQIQGLLVVTILAGIIWMVLMYVVLRRDAERRERRRAGLPPLPSFYKQAYDYLMQPRPTAPATEKIEPFPTPVDNFALPDLDALTADLPAPQLDMLTQAMPAAKDDSPLLEFEGDFVLDDSPPAPAHVAAAIIGEEVVIPIKEPVVSDNLTYRAGSNELPGDAVELMRVWRDVSDGRLIIGMKDQLFASLSEVQEATMRTRFQKMVQDLQQIANAAPMQPSVKKAASSPSPAATSSEPLGMADQIEMLLQSKLLRTPDLMGRNIHVHSGTSGGVMIEVDGLFYDAVGDVIDTHVRHFLQETIQEWESRS